MIFEKALKKYGARVRKDASTGHMLGQPILSQKASGIARSIKHFGGTGVPPYLVVGARGVGRKTFVRQVVRKLDDPLFVSVDLGSISSSQFWALPELLSFLGSWRFKLYQPVLMLEGLQFVRGEDKVHALEVLFEQAVQSRVVVFALSVSVAEIHEYYSKICPTITIANPDERGYAMILSMLLSAEAGRLHELVKPAMVFTPGELSTIASNAEAIAREHTSDGRINSKVWYRACIEHDLKTTPNDRSLLLSDVDRVAYHEASHAVVAHAVNTGAWRTVYLTNYSYGSMLGLLQLFHVEKRKHVWTLNDYAASIMITLAGVLGEEAFFGERSDGGRRDFEIIEDTIDALKESGLLSPGSHTYKHGMAVDEIAERFVDELTEETKKSIVDNLKLIKDLAEHLMLVREMSHAEIEEFIAPRVKKADYSIQIGVFGEEEDDDREE